MAVDTVVEALHHPACPLTQLDINPGVELPGIITMGHNFL